jgi:hypothetical protein
MGLPRVNFHRPWFKDVGNFDNEDQATIALEHRQPPCPSPLQFRVGHGPQELSLDDSEELLRMTRHARYAEVCAAQSATVPSATRDAATLEGIGELFRPLNERFRTMDLQFADDDSETWGMLSARLAPMAPGHAVPVELTMSQRWHTSDLMRTAL